MYCENANYKRFVYSVINHLLNKLNILYFFIFLNFIIDSKSQLLDTTYHHQLQQQLQANSTTFVATMSLMVTSANSHWKLRASLKNLSSCASQIVSISVTEVKLKMKSLSSHYWKPRLSFHYLNTKTAIWLVPIQLM